MTFPTSATVLLFTGTIRPLPESGRPTGMYKQPVTAVIDLGPEGFAGDEQADRKVHGGPEKAVHLYPAAHYARLAARFPEAAEKLVPGSLGENLSTAELDEDSVRLGECWQLGEAVLQLCQPRSPCWKIDERFGCDGMARFIAEENLTGWYWRVLTPGRVQPGDTLQRLPLTEDRLTLGAALRLCQITRPALDDLEALARTPGLAAGWRDKLLKRLDWLRANTL